ncbi:MAG: hypothetical protein KIH10_16010 [Candidatus Freyarchaeota archaeon]|nr:hypothetical protein [Candidatus Jordarchaeia archaeon]
MDSLIGRLWECDKTIFARILEAYTKHDMVRANGFANGLAEIRKMEKMIMHARLALEHILWNLKVVSTLKVVSMTDDLILTLASAIGVLRRIRTGIASIFPDTEKELGRIGNLLNGILIDAAQPTGMTINFETANEAAQKILKEAASVAEQRIKDKLSELPAGMPSRGEASERSSE